MAPVHSRLSHDLLLKYHSAFNYANASKKEALWYGVWAWLLDNNIFRDLSAELNESTLHRTTVTYAQYPLATDADTKEHDFIDIPPFRLHSADVDDEDDFVNIDDRNSTPPPTTAYFRDTKGLSPESNDELDSLMPRLMTPPRYATTTPPNPQSVASEWRTTLNSSSPHIKSVPIKRLTRIPDFAELLHYLDGEHNIRHTYLLMIIEIKRLPSGRAQSRDELLVANRQVHTQAMHAFLSPEHKHVHQLGAIIAVGRFWRYIEFHRTALPGPYRSESEMTYRTNDNEEPRDRGFDIAQIKEIEEIEAFYDPAIACCELGTAASDEAFQVVRQCMIAIANEYVY